MSDEAASRMHRDVVVTGGDVEKIAGAVPTVVSAVPMIDEALHSDIDIQAERGIIQGDFRRSSRQRD